MYNWQTAHFSKHTALPMAGVITVRETGTIRASATVHCGDVSAAWEDVMSIVRHFPPVKDQLPRAVSLAERTGRRVETSVAHAAWPAFFWPLVASGEITFDVWQATMPFWLACMRAIAPGALADNAHLLDRFHACKWIIYHYDDTDAMVDQCGRILGSVAPTSVVAPGLRLPVEELLHQLPVDDPPTAAKLATVSVVVLVRAGILLRAHELGAFDSFVIDFDARASHSPSVHALAKFYASRYYAHSTATATLVAVDYTLAALADWLCRQDCVPTGVELVKLCEDLIVYAETGYLCDSYAVIDAAEQIRRDHIAQSAQPPPTGQLIDNDDLLEMFDVLSEPGDDGGDDDPTASDDDYPDDDDE